MSRCPFTAHGLLLMGHRFRVIAFGLWSAIWLTAVALILSSCSNDPIIQYRVSGTAVRAEILYRDRDGFTMRETVSLPWETRFRLPDPFEFEISVYGDGRSGSVSCVVLINDKEAGSAEGMSYAECVGSYEAGVSRFHGRYDIPKTP